MTRATAFLFASLPAIAAAQAPSYSADIVPIVEKYCIGCHATSVKLGSLDLSTYEGLAKGGNHGNVVVPGKPEESRLLLMVSGKAKPAMPMDGNKLAAGEIELLHKWIEAGAKGPAPGDKPVPAARAGKIEPRTAVKPQIFAMAWRPGGSELALAGFREVRLHDAASGKSTGALSGHQEAVRAVAFSKDGKFLAAAGGVPGKEGEVKVWDMESRKELRTIRGHADAIYAAAFSPDGSTLATSSYDKLIKLWDVAEGKEIRTLKDHIDAVYALAFTPDGKRLVSGAADRTIKVWNPVTGERLFTLSDASDGINSIALDSSGKLLVAGGLDKTLRLWSLDEKSGTLENSLIAHEDAILKVAFSPDGRRLVTSSADKTIKIFSAPDLTELKSFGGQSDWVYGIEFAPGGKTFAAGRLDGSLSLLEADPKEVRSAAR